ncbi:MAG: YfiT family bacillithiol transferase [Rhodothermales bacterium]
MTDLRYPIGKYQPAAEVNAAYIEESIADIEAMPALLRQALDGLTSAQLDTPYRPEGWTVRQLVHHIGDSHLNSVIRFKWTLTEATPTIKAYNQNEWATTSDVLATPVDVNLDFLETLHVKWVLLLKSMEGNDWQKAFVHPETGKKLTLGWLVGLYAWHGKHHVAHITGLRDREGW